jgi:hypothetical protein
MASTYNKFYQFSEDVMKGVHNFTSDSTCTLMIALTNVAPVATNSILSDISQITYTNLSTRVMTGVTAEQALGVVTLTIDDLTLSATGAVASFRYVVLYNDDPTSPLKPLICWFDYGSVVTMQNGEFFAAAFPSEILTLG